MRRGAAASTALAMAALAWLAADHGCRARVVSWFQPWVRSDAWTMGDAQIVTERLRFPEPYPEDGIVDISDPDRLCADEIDQGGDERLVGRRHGKVAQL